MIISKTLPTLFLFIFPFFLYFVEKYFWIECAFLEKSNGKAKIQNIEDVNDKK